MFKRNFKSVFTLNVLTLASGSGISQVIPLLFYPILSRLFTESDYAVFGIYLGIFEFLAIVITGRYELTIVLPKSEFVTRNLVAGSMALSFLLSVLVLIIVWIFHEPIGVLLNNTAVSPYLFFLPVILFIYALNRILTHWLIRKEAFRSISYNKIFHKSTDTLAASGLGLLKVSSGLVLGDLAGRIVLLALNFRSSIKKTNDYSRIRVKYIRMALRRYITFPLYNTLPALANSLANILPVFLVSAYFDETTSGSYNFSRIILAAPIALVSTSISQVLTQRLSEKNNRSESARKLLWMVFLALSAIAVVMILLVSIAGPNLFALVFGEKWELAGSLSSILIFSYGLQFVLVAMYPVFFVFNGIKIGSAWQMFYLIAVLFLFLLSNHDVYSFMKIYVSIVSGAFAIYGALLFYVIKRYEKGLPARQSSRA